MDKQHAADLDKLWRCDRCPKSGREAFYHGHKVDGEWTAFHKHPFVNRHRHEHPDE